MAGPCRQCDRLLLGDRSRWLQEPGWRSIWRATQLPKLFGFKGTHGDFWERSAYFIAHLGDTHRISLLVGTVALAGLIAGKLWLKNRPVAFLVVVSGILAARVLNLEADGVALLGDVPQGLPSMGLPAREPRRSERAPAAGDGELRPRGRGDVGYRTDVRSEARLSVRCQSGAAGASAPAICSRGSVADSL